MTVYVERLCEFVVSSFPGLRPRAYKRNVLVVLFASFSLGIIGSGIATILSVVV